MLEEEGAPETCDELTVTPITCSPVPLRVGEKVGKMGSEVKPGKEGGD